MENKQQGISPLLLAWKRFRSNPVSVAGLVIISLAVLIAFSGYILTPDKTKHANTQVLEIALAKPGFQVSFLKIRLNAGIPKQNFFEKTFKGQVPVYQYVPFHSYELLDDRIIVNEYSKYKEDQFYSEHILVDLFFPIDIGTYKFSNGIYSVKSFDGSELYTGKIDELTDRLNENIEMRNFLFGADRFGRDMMSRLILGTRVSLTVGFIAVMISLVLGIFLGGLAGFFRGWVDWVIMWLVNVIWSVPTLLMVISITLVLGKGYWQVFIAVGLTMWVEVARVVRGQVLSIREKEFVDAARVIGMRPGGILFRHIIPNVLSPVIIISAANFATAILLEAGLSFLGIGVQPPVPTWGSMIKEHYGYIIVNHGFLAFIPGIAIMLMVLAFTLVGNGLRDALDTRA